MLKKKILLVPLALLLIASLVACAAPTPAPAPTTTATVTAPAPAPAPVPAPVTASLRLSHDQPPGSDVDEAVKKFIKLVDERTNGRIKIESFPAGQLGDYTMTFPEVALGSIDIMLGSMPAAYDPRLTIIYLPYLVSNWDEVNEAYTPGGVMWDTLDNVLGGMGISLVGCWAGGLGGYTFVKLPDNVADPDKPKNVKIRVPTMLCYDLQAQRMGYSTVPLPWAEVLLALETGVIDGRSGSSPHSAYHYDADFVKYYVHYIDHFEGWYCIMNAETLSSLPEADQKIIKDSAVEATSISFTLGAENDDKWMKGLEEEKGVTVIRLTDAERANIAEAIRADVWPQLAGDYGKFLMDQVIARFGG